LCSLALLGGTAHAQPGGEDPGNTYYRYDNTQLEAFCNTIAPSRYVSGLTDGGWGSLGLGGKTYYYRSACYLELVRRTGRAELCPQVVERRTLFGDGSSHTPEVCAKVAAAYQAAQQRNAASKAAFDQAVQGAFRISGGTVKLLPNRNWRLEISIDGERAGDYALEVVMVRDGTVLFRESVAIAQKRTFAWELDRNTIVGNTTLPNIFPVAVHMHYRVPASAHQPATEHSTGTYNVTLSAE
jgi:hypothetical protein